VTPISYRCLLFALLVLFADAVPLPAQDSWLPASPDKLPRWRGFNLLNRFYVGQVQPFTETDFQIIHDLGFNFVRVPMDYRIWIRNGDWTQIDEHKAFDDLNRAIGWAAKYHVHVCLNFHRAPGYTVAKPPEAKSLWADPEAQRVCALHWAAFARHYKGVPNERLSFNPFNEPDGSVSGATYARVMSVVVKAIRDEDPSRLVIADGLQWAQLPCPDLVPLHIAQSYHDYEPHTLTHYHASWMEGSDTWPVPTWPMVRAYSYLYGPDKKEFQQPLVMTGNFPAGTRVDLTVDTVSVKGRLVVRADGAAVLDKSYACPPGKVREVFEDAQSVVLAAPTKEIALSNEEGDWLTLGALKVTVSGAEYPVNLDPTWAMKEPPLIFQGAGQREPWASPDQVDGAWLWQHDDLPWQQLESQGVGVMVGEWGCYNQTPYDVTLRWMEDNLKNFQRAGWGWALWNLYGEFGILDSDRKGAVYENYRGHKLDRRMLNLLQKY
jgi:aryl-phospho-beta-D-glucosidase BglC (GH1 family)